MMDHESKNSLENLIDGEARDYFVKLEKEAFIAGIVLVFGAIIALVTMLILADSPDPKDSIGLLFIACIGGVCLYFRKRISFALMSFAQHDTSE